MRKISIMLFAVFVMAAQAQQITVDTSVPVKLNVSSKQSFTSEAKPQRWKVCLPYKGRWDISPTTILTASPLKGLMWELQALILWRRKSLPRCSNLLWDARWLE